MRTYRQVMTTEPPIADFLLRHRERLLDVQHPEDVPKGLWVCEENGEPIIALLAYTDPYLRVSVIIDKPETRPFASLTKLARHFETWGKQIGGSGYAVVIAQTDEHYRYIIEGFGGHPARQTPEWTEFFIPFDRTPNLEPGIRPWEALDWPGLKPLVRAYLFDIFATGSPILPTPINVNRFLSMYMAAARDGDPILVGIDQRKVVAFGGATAPHSPYDLTEGYGMGIGTYVIPAHRRQRWGTRIREELFTRAVARGYTRLTGQAYTLPGLQSAKALGMKEQAIVLTKVI